MPGDNWEATLADKQRLILQLTAEVQRLQQQVEAATPPPSAKLVGLRTTHDKLVNQKLHLERSIAAHEQLPAAAAAGSKKQAKKAAKKGGAAPVENGAPQATAPSVDVPRTSPETMDPEVSADYLVSLRDHVADLFAASLKSAFPGETDLPLVVVPVSGAKAIGDYQFNSAMAIAKLLKGKPLAPTTPFDAALRIVAHMPSSRAVKEVKISGPGFIHVEVNVAFLEELVQHIITDGVKPPKTERKRVCVDFSSPNIAKEMHVGHLRSTIIGECIARLMEYLGHETLRINHVGDWGTQFGMLIAHLKDMFPDFQKVSPPIGDLQAFYKESKKRFDEDEDFRARAHLEVVALQAHEPAVHQAWQLICDVSRKEFQKVYDRLDVTLEETGESFYQPMMPGIVKMLEEKGMVTMDEGRKVVFVEGQSVPLTVEKSNGSYTYDTSDLAALNYRINHLKADWALYVVDAGQGLHFDLLFAAARAAGIYDPKKNRVEHIGFGVVLGEDRKKFKTRSGDTVRLVDLLDEAVERSKAIIEAKQATIANPAERLSEEEMRAAYEAVAYGGVKYNDLKSNRVGEYVFSFDRMLDLRGNTAVYLIYAYTRIASIARRAKVTDVRALQGEVKLEHPKEVALAKQLARFPDIIMRITNDLAPHALCEYLYELSTYFTEFYEACRVIEMNDGVIQNVNASRLKLCESTAQVMAKGFDILGLRYVPRM